MVKAQNKGCVLRYMVLVCLAVLLSFGMAKISHALSEEKLDEFAQNNILFYDPGASDVCVGARYNGELTWDDLDEKGTGYGEAVARLGLIVETYGKLAMNLQRYYGIPWEMIFGIMVRETSVGTDIDPDNKNPSSWNPNKKAKEAGMFELMGLTEGDDWFNTDVNTKEPIEDKYKSGVQELSVCSESDGTCGYKLGDRGTQAHKFKNYSTISSMMLGYVIYHVRSGKGDNYVEGLKLLTPENYSESLRRAVGLMMSHYCSSASGDCYDDALYNIIIGEDAYGAEIKRVAKKNGWPSSAELARQENLPAGGYVSTEEFVSENGWGGWSDIRQDAWNAYKSFGLPADVASGLGGYDGGCNQLISGTCSNVDLSQFGKNPGGCTKDDFIFYWQGGDNIWTNLDIAGGCWEKFKDGGCGYAATAMAITALTNVVVTPDITLAEAQSLYPDNSGYICNVGSGWDVHGKVIKSLSEKEPSLSGLKSMFHNSGGISVDVVNEVLDKGGMVLTTVDHTVVRYWEDLGSVENSGQLTTGGHYIVIRKKISDDKWQIFTSSNKPSNSANDYIYVASDIVNASKKWYTEIYGK